MSLRGYNWKKENHLRMKDKEGKNKKKKNSSFIKYVRKRLRRNILKHNEHFIENKYDGWEF